MPRGGGAPRLGGSPDCPWTTPPPPPPGVSGAGGQRCPIGHCAPPGLARAGARHPPPPPHPTPPSRRGSLPEHRGPCRDPGHPPPPPPPRQPAALPQAGQSWPAGCRARHAGGRPTWDRGAFAHGPGDGPGGGGPLCAPPSPAGSPARAATGDALRSPVSSGPDPAPVRVLDRSATRTTPPRAWGCRGSARGAP